MIQSSSISPPNQLTLLRIVLTPLFVYCLFLPDPLYKQIAFAIFIIAAITDWYDGYVARRWGYVTRWGRFLDPLADKVLTSAAFFSFIFIGYAEAWMVWIIIVRDFLITGLRTYAEYKHTPINTSSFAKTKTFAQLIVIYVFLANYIVHTSPQLNASLGWLFNLILTPPVMFTLMLITTLLTALTGALYVQTNALILKKLFSQSMTQPTHNGTKP